MKSDAEVFGLGNRRFRRKQDAGGTSFNDYAPPPQNDPNNSVSAANQQVGSGLTSAPPTGALPVHTSPLQQLDGTDPLSAPPMAPLPTHTSPLQQPVSGTDQSNPTQPPTYTTPLQKPNTGVDPASAPAPLPAYTTPLQQPVIGADQTVTPPPTPMPAYTTPLPQNGTDLSPDALLNLLSAQQRRVGR